MLCEMQSASSRIWIRAAVSISYDDNHCTTGTFTVPPARAENDSRSIFMRSLSSEFSFSLTSCLTKAEEPSLPYYLPIAVGRIIGFITFARVLVLCEMHSASFGIWTRVAVFISYEDNHYTMGNSKLCTNK